jgi:hypothetical protein
LIGDGEALVLPVENPIEDSTLASSAFVISEESGGSSKKLS